MKAAPSLQYITFRRHNAVQVIIVPQRQSGTSAGGQCSLVVQTRTTSNWEFINARTSTNDRTALKLEAVI